jgi:hypothetical protein
MIAGLGGRAAEVGLIRLSSLPLELLEIVTAGDLFHAERPIGRRNGLRLMHAYIKISY